MKKQKKWQETQNKIEAIEKPDAPIILVGHRWNHVVYGKPGNFSVYLDGKKVSISDQEAEEIKYYLAKNEEYKKKVEELS